MVTADTAARRAGSPRPLDVRRWHAGALSWSIHCRVCDVRIEGARTQARAIDVGHQHLAEQHPGGMDGARALVAELRAAGHDPTGWLVDLVDDNMVRYERAPSARDAPKRRKR